MRIKTGDFAGAEEVLENLVEANPLDILGVTMLATGKIRNGEYKELKELLDNPQTGFHFDHFVVNYYRGVSYFATEEELKAKASLESSFRESSGMAFSTSIMLGQIAEKERKWNDMAHYLKIALAINPRACPLYMKLAEVYAKEGKAGEAKAEQGKAARCHSE
jgi:uncharacterized protein HemY